MFEQNDVNNDVVENKHESVYPDFHDMCVFILFKQDDPLY